MIDRLGDLRRKTRERHKRASVSSYGSLDESTTSSSDHEGAGALNASGVPQYPSETFRKLAQHRELSLPEVEAIKKSALKIKQLTREYLLTASNKKERALAEEAQANIVAGKEAMGRVKKRRIVQANIVAGKEAMGRVKKRISSGCGDELWRGVGSCCTGVGLGTHHVVPQCDWEV